MPEEVAREYHTWYTSARVLLVQVASGMEKDFVRLYEGSGRSVTSISEIEQMGISDALARWSWTPAQSVMVTKLNSQAGMIASLPKIIELHASNLRSLVAYDLMTDELAAAEHLVGTGYTRAAGAVASVVLERHLKLMCASRDIAVGDREMVGSLNQKLKDQYSDPADYKKVGWFSEIRAQCDHDKGKEPDTTAVTDLISGVKKFISTVS
jgi:hypothetical protein